MPSRRTFRAMVLVFLRAAELTLVPVLRFLVGVTPLMRMVPRLRWVPVMRWTFRATLRLSVPFPLRAKRLTSRVNQS